MCTCMEIMNELNSIETYLMSFGGFINTPFRKYSITLIPDRIGEGKLPRYN